MWTDTERQEYICKSTWTVRCYFFYSKCYCSQLEPWKKKKTKELLLFGQRRRKCAGWFRGHQGRCREILVLVRLDGYGGSFHLDWHFREMTRLYSSQTHTHTRTKWLWNRRNLNKSANSSPDAVTLMDVKLKRADMMSDSTVSPDPQLFLPCSV